MKKLNKYKIFFLLSLIPYAAILVYAVYAAITGIGYSFLFSFRILYGFEGFLYALIIGTLSLIVFPILPICFIYQIVNLELRKKENKKPIRIATFIVAGLLFLLIGGWSINKINLALEKNHIEAEVSYNVSELLKNADEIIEDYGSSGRQPDGIAGTKFTKNTILIDYDSKKVTFLFVQHPQVYKEYALSENIKIDSKNMQYQKDLNYPGKTFTTFYPDSNKSRTVAIEICMADGSVYSINEIKDEDGRLADFLDFPWSIFN